MRSAIVLFASAAALVTAQNFTVDPASIDLTTKASWCQGEYNSCKTLCANTPTANDCDPTTLKFTCTCANGTAPGLQYYTQTLPTFECLQAFDNCIQATVGNSQGQDNCKTTILANCGTLDPNKAQVGSGSSAPSTSATTAPSASTAAAAAPSSSTSHAAAPTNNVQAVGNAAGAIAIGLFALLV